MQSRRKFPAEIGGVFEAGVDAVAAIGRMAVRGVAGDEDAAHAVLIRDRDAQVPKADVLELDVELLADRRMQKAAEIEIVFCRTERHRRVKEPGSAEIDAAEELPVALQVGMQHIVEGLVGEALQQPVQAGRAEHQQHHQPVVIGQGLRNAGGRAHQRAAAVAADHIVCPQHALPIALRSAIVTCTPSASCAMPEALQP